jgi:predicted O-methyltransferase YrrM
VRPKPTPDQVAEWFDAEYAPKLGHRAPTFRAALMKLRANQGKLIVESGTARQAENWGGDGQSTVLFAEYGRKFLAALVSIDTDPRACEIAQATIKARMRPVHVSIRCGDARAEIDAINAPIDLLYLDSLDFKEHDPEPSQIQALAEFDAAEPWLHVESLVLIDDCALPHGGKGGMVIPEMERRGWHVLASGYQVLLARG